VRKWREKEREDANKKDEGKKATALGRAFLPI
jgi:hypothetical protein